MPDFKEIERKTFQTARDDGLLDVMMAAFVSMFALAPLWSEALGDFWSSAVFGPIWFAGYLVVRYLRIHIVTPRLGSMEPGIPRQQRLRRVGMVTTVVLVIAYFIGVAAAQGFGSDWFELGELVYPVTLGVTALIVFSLTGYSLSVWRYFLYGVLVAIAPLIAEWLWQNDLAAHHGYPVAFGSVAVIMLTAGIARLLTIIRDHPLPATPRAI
jgi:hypothetical protein